MLTRLFFVWAMFLFAKPHVLITKNSGFLNDKNIIQNLNIVSSKLYKNFSSKASCPDGFGLYNGYCYHLGIAGGAYISWPNAQKACHQLNSELASIHNAYEQAFLGSLAKGMNTWIGLVKEDNLWKWIDNTNYDYTDWYPGEPGGDGVCAEICSFENMQWNDRACDGTGASTFETKQYICKVVAQN